MRLNAFLAKAGVSSRRGADAIIKADRVKVNGQIGRLNTVVTEKDRVEVDGKEVTAQKRRYILLNKPAGTVTTAKDPQGRRTVVQLIDIAERVSPVGRLDFDTTGALLLTNDGQFAYKLMHPSFGVEKVYEVTVEGTITPEILNKLSIGVDIGDGITSPAKARKISERKIELTIHEGRKHQVKRMLSAVGLYVIKLHRSKYGPLGLDGLKLGQWRDLSPKEIAELKSL